MAEAGSAKPAIELVDVVKDFEGVRVLDGVDLAVPRGAITVLLGPSGAGKTVTVNHILGLIHPPRRTSFASTWRRSSRARCRSRAGSSSA